MSWATTNLVIWACLKQNENILKECIEMKYNLNETSLLGCLSPLMVAVLQQNNLNQIKLLVTNGADLNYVNYSGHCVLDCTENNDYLLFLQNNGARKLKDPTDGMSKLAIEILNDRPCSITTKEDVNQVDARGFTPFLWAIYYERQNYIDYYLELGADVNQAGRTGITPLMMAICQRKINIVQKLVENGAKLNQLDHNGLSAIAYSRMFFSSTAIVDYLLENGAIIDPCISEKGRSPLMIAAIKNNTIDFNYALNKNANVNFIDCDGNSVLSYAILNKNIEHAEKLIAKGANLDACGPKGKTPLAWSVFLNNPEITKFLLDHGANVNCTDHQGRTALDYAEKYQYTDIIKLLKDNGAIPTITQNKNIFSALRTKDINLIKNVLNNLNIYDKNEKNETVMDVAIQLGDLDVITLLLDKEKDTFVHTALPTAIETKNIPLVKLLLKKGANVNRIDKKTKQSPLTQAINQQNPHIVELLLKSNANVNTSEDPSPFQRALQLKHDKIVEMLIEKVADINAPQNGKSLLQMAIDENNISVIIFLLKKGADPRNALGHLKKLAEDCAHLEIILENVLANFNQTNAERKTNKTEYKTNKTE